MNSLSLQNRHTGETLRMRRERDVSGQVILLVEGSVPPRTNGPPPHVHFQQREEDGVQAGTLGARIGEQTLVVQTGGMQLFRLGSFTLGGMPKPFWSSVIAYFRQLT